MIEDVLRLNCILDEEHMPHVIIGDIISQTQVVNSMNSDGSVVRIMNGTAHNIRLMDRTDNMEMNRIPAKLKCLSCVVEFNM